MTPGPGITRTPLPKDFYASGINSGVRRYRPDLGMVYSTLPAVTAGVFTLNECKAASVRYSQNLVPSTNIQAIITNSGQANAATGPLGEENNFIMASSLAKSLNLQTEQVLTASTGVIGVQLEMDKIIPAIPELVERKGKYAEPFALAIMTTDLVPKTVSMELSLERGHVRLTGMAKGSGMIHPQMATMLAYFLTDAVITPTEACSFLETAVDKSFNMISVDGDCSTNDCTFFMANGASGVSLVSSKDRLKFQKALEEMSILLAKAIARDGEGATKLIEVHLRGSPSEHLARTAARGLVQGQLVKTAIHGEDPNWGRILANLGAHGVSASLLQQMTMQLQGTTLFASGTPVVVEREFLRQQLKEETVTINIDFHSGPFSATAWGCDLSKKYVEINSEYTT